MRHYLLMLFPLIAALLLPLVSPAQSDDPNAGKTLVGRIGAPGKNKFTVALPQPVGSGDAVATFYEVVRRDLELSGWVEVIDPGAYIEPSGTGVQMGQFRFEDWEIVGAVGLAKTTLRREGGALRSEVWVYDVPGRRKLGAKAFSTTETRALAHKVANEIIYLLTGQQGIFNTRFAAAVKSGGNKEIHVVDFDGFNNAAVTKNGSINLQPSWSPSGSKIAFTSYMGGNPDLYVADLGSGKITRLSARSGINTGASWAPAGNMLALTLSPAGDPEVYTIDAFSGKQIARLTRSTGIDTSPSFSPDGRQIAFVSERSGGAQVYVMNADGSGVRRVTFAGSHNTDPAWSPKNDAIAYVTRSGVFDVCTVSLASGNVTRITQGQGDNEDPTWSPDGYYVAFSSTRAGGSHIWMSTADGYHQVQLTRGGGGYTNPSWSPPIDW